jgi:hypothetical protein
VALSFVGIRRLRHPETPLTETFARPDLGNFSRGAFFWHVNARNLSHWK